MVIPSRKQQPHTCRNGSSTIAPGKRKRRILGLLNTKVSLVTAVIGTAFLVICITAITRVILSVSTRSSIRKKLPRDHLLLLRSRDKSQHDGITLSLINSTSTAHRHPALTLPQHLISGRHRLPTVSIVDQPLPHEAWFHQTIRSCNPSGGETTTSKTCKTFVDETPKDAATSPKQRVALIAPPGGLDETIFQYVQDIVRQHNDHVLAQKNPVEDVNRFPMELIRTTHVPPYGYGKTHGWTKIIRVVSQPVALQATSALLSLSTALNERNVTMTDLIVATRQILRFHCRLSHVAAHTAVLSVSLQDFVGVSTPSASLHSSNDLVRQTRQTIRAFLSPLVAAEQSPRSDGQPLAAHDDETAPQKQRSSAVQAHYEEHVSQGTQLLSLLQAIQTAQQAVVPSDAESANDILHLLDQVIVSEMDRSKNMTAWPCLPFWNSGDDGAMSMIDQRLAAQLSPDCLEDAHASCWVARDICEAKGDGICAGNK
jgi:hypothetical protein